MLSSEIRVNLLSHLWSSFFQNWRWDRILTIFSLIQVRNTIYCVHCSPQTCHLSNVLCTVQAIWSTLYLTKTLLWLHLDAINQVYCKWWHLTTNSHCITPCICTFSPFWTYVLFIYYIIILGKPSNKKFDICQIPLDPPPSGDEW